MPEVRNSRTDDVVDLVDEPVSGSGAPRPREPLYGTVTVAHIVYGLHTISILIGLVTAGMSIAGAFIFSAPSILAVIVNYIFRSDAEGTWVESHFAWQIATFWRALLGLFLIYLISIPLMFLFGVGLFVSIAGMLVLGIWVAWRILAGWRRLVARREMPV